MNARLNDSSNRRAASSGAIATAILLAVAGSASSQTRPVPFDVPWISYETAVYPEGLFPAASRVADFNADLVPDLAVVSFSGTGNLSILLGDGDGGYEPFVTYALTLESNDVEVGDFDRDGDIDVAVAETGRFWEGNVISIWSNNGSGQFTRTRLLGAGSTGPNGLTTADFNGDGWLDFAVAHDRYIEYGNSIAVILSDGIGGFRSPAVHTLTAGTNRITVGDLDGDTDIDLAVGHETNRWTFMRNGGSGLFTSAGTFTGIDQGSLPEDPTIHVVDFDRDGDQDVFYGHADSGGFYEGAFGFWRNSGGGNFPAPQVIELNWYTRGPSSIRTADVTGDGWLDALVATSSSQWYLVAGNGSGGFDAPQRFRCGRNPRSIQAADLDGDTDLEVIVVCSESMGACVYQNPGDGTFIQPPVIDMTSPGLSPAFPTNLLAGDIDGDGDLDLVAGFRADFAEQHGITVRRNNGDGTFAAIETYSASTYPTVVRLADISGDGRLDLVFRDSTGAIRTRLNGGNGSFGAMQFITAAYVEGDMNLWDVNADGALDVVFSGFFEVNVAINRGTGSFNAPVHNTTTDFVRKIGMGDFNGDGFPDLLTDSGLQGSATVAFGLGDGRFQTSLEVPAGRGVRAFGAADFDRNASIDFGTIYNLDETGLGVRRNRGNGDFHILDTYHGSYGYADHTSSLSFGDAEGDGEIDAFTANFSAQDVSYWKGVGDGAFDRLMRLGVGQDAYDMITGDFDGDGTIDLAVLCQVDSGRWWYPGVILLKGIAPSDFDIILSQTPLRRGQTATLHAQGAVPGEQVYFLYSTRGLGQGACPPQLGGLCLDLRNPLTIIDSAPADASGMASLRLNIPGGAPLGTPVFTQAVIRRGPGGAWSVKSRPVESQITQ